MRYKGFSLIDVAFAGAVLSGAILYSLSAKQQARVVQSYELLGRDLGKVVLAVDRRIALDGRATDWTADLQGNEVVVEELVSKLNSRRFDDCGDWVPLADPDSKVNLLPCDFWAEGIESDGLLALSVEKQGNHVSLWALDYYSFDPQEYNNILKYSGLMLDSARSLYSQRYTGVHFMRLIDLDTGEERVAADCLEVGTCALRVGIDYLQYIESTEDAFLRLDGENGMIGSLLFGRGEDSVECFDVEGSSVYCGISFDGRTLNAYADSIHAVNLDLISGSSGIGADQLCIDESGRTVACGVMSRMDGVTASVGTMALTDKLIIADAPDGAQVEISSDGMRVESDFNIAGSLLLDTADVSIGEISGRVDVSERVTADRIDLAGGLVSGNSSVRTVITLSSHGSPCSEDRELGMDSSGEFLVCRGGMFREIETVRAPNGVLFTEASECPDPDNFIKVAVRSDNTRVNFMRRGFAYQERSTDGDIDHKPSTHTASNASLSRTYGDNLFRFNLSEMPPHEHGYLRMEELGRASRGTGSRRGYSGYDVNDTKEEGGSQRFNIEPGNYPMNVCIPR